MRFCLGTKTHRRANYLSREVFHVYVNGDFLDSLRHCGCVCPFDQLFAYWKQHVTRKMPFSFSTPYVRTVKSKSKESMKISPIHLFAYIQYSLAIGNRKLNNIAVILKIYLKRFLIDFPIWHECSIFLTWFLDDLNSNLAPIFGKCLMPHFTKKSVRRCPAETKWAVGTLVFVVVMLVCMGWDCVIPSVPSL